MKTKRPISLVLAAALLLSVSLPFTSAATTEKVSPQNVYAFADSRSMPAPKIHDDASKKARMDKVMLEAEKVWADTGDMDKVNEFLRNNDFTIITPSVEPTEVGILSSTAQNVTMSLPGVAYDNATGWYTITATMNWKKNSVNVPWWMTEINLGAGDADLVGVSLGDGQNSNFTNKGYMLQIRDKNGNGTNITNAESWNNSGVIWRPQDVFSGSDALGNGNYNLDSYFAALYVVYKGSQTGIPVFNVYGHTWKQTNITGFGFQPWGISVSFQNNNYGWQATSNPKYFN